jgi:monofunctional biosynthetic peptidoglycan transglycosylase
MRRWLKRIIVALLVVFVAAPAALLAIYRFAPVPATPLMVIRLFEGEGWQRRLTPLDHISAHVPQAVIAAEDNLFCEHSGFDWESIRDAVETAQGGGRLRGASTISQQTAKNLLLWPGRSFIRKGIEAWFTVMTEALLPKRRIMEIYLNVAEWGPGVYGIGAAARHHFGKPAAQLTRREAALLVALLPNPRNRRAAPPSSGVASQATTIERRIGQLGPRLDCVRPRGG